MSRFKPPLRATRKADQQRREKRRSWLLLLGISLLMLASLLGYLLYLLPRLRQSREHSHKPRP